MQNSAKAPVHTDEQLDKLAGTSREVKAVEQEAQKGNVAAARAQSIPPFLVEANKPQHDGETLEQLAKDMPIKETGRANSY